MRLRGHSRWLIAGSLGLLLQGCAAAVIPVAAGVLMGDTLRKGNDTGGGTVEIAEAGETETVEAVPANASPQNLAAEAAAANAGNSESIQLLDLTELPPPSAPAGTSARSVSVINSFASYSLEQAAFYGTDADEARLSALLEEPGSLRPQRANCKGLPPAVLIDLDPGKDTADPLTDIPIPQELAPALKTLREADIRIAWVSRIGEGFADPLRMQLVRRGFDTAYSDLVAIPANLDQRKQTLREGLSKQYCVIAILGDDRADFDELYLYLKNDDAAFALESIIGQGWFLAPEFGQASAAPTQNSNTSDDPSGDQ
ncbi:hypothetical protein ACRAQ7_06350 [Erythrobacter sp. W53]|uniref:hypothetical protein n=1 Tax=Erythrobacter sp. W53 TaxID=3425947 RepID=UPI003D7687B4